jgi:hypothetical protein
LEDSTPTLTVITEELLLRTSCNLNHTSSMEDPSGSSFFYLNILKKI